MELNMGYYKIELNAQSKDMKTISTKFGKFRCNRILMGMCNSSYIFQAKVDKILGGKR